MKLGNLALCSSQLSIGSLICPILLSGTAVAGEWAVAYGGIKGDYAYAIQQTGDGGYIVAGNIDSPASGSDDVWILKLNANGSVTDCNYVQIRTTSAVAASTNSIVVKAEIHLWV